jgi:hypothetical protein
MEADICSTELRPELDIKSEPETAVEPNKLLLQAPESGWDKQGDGLSPANVGRGGAVSGEPVAHKQADTKEVPAMPMVSGEGEEEEEEESDNGPPEFEDDGSSEDKQAQNQQPEMASLEQSDSRREQHDPDLRMAGREKGPNSAAAFDQLAPPDFGSFDSPPPAPEVASPHAGENPFDFHADGNPFDLPLATAAASGLDWQAAASPSPPQAAAKGEADDSDSDATDESNNPDVVEDPQLAEALRRSREDEKEAQGENMREPRRKAKELPVAIKSEDLAANDQPDSANKGMQSPNSSSAAARSSRPRRGLLCCFVRRPDEADDENSEEDADLESRQAVARTKLQDALDAHDGATLQAACEEAQAAGVDNEVIEAARQSHRDAMFAVNRRKLFSKKRACPPNVQQSLI